MNGTETSVNKIQLRQALGKIARTAWQEINFVDGCAVLKGSVVLRSSNKPESYLKDYGSVLASWIGEGSFALEAKDQGSKSTLYFSLAIGTEKLEELVKKSGLDVSQPARF